jgi:hypothetical protein
MSKSLKANGVKQQLYEPSYRREDTAQPWNGDCFREGILRESESRWQAHYENVKAVWRSGSKKSTVAGAASSTRRSGDISIVL